MTLITKTKSIFQDTSSTQQDVITIATDQHVIAITTIGKQLDCANLQTADFNHIVTSKSIHILLAHDGRSRKR
ncbi:MAG: hypothetical protein K6T90_07525 [Leptolyngbyaceae cyanobacterium HOT.MB2.61]|nr:hypothetical protein [Leptolyngbyaceae cyanobacterium HOT.MB2.61]